MKVVFMGTPDFAVPSLEVLVKSSRIEVEAVVTQPDRPRGRGQKIQPLPIKAKALELGLEIWQDEDVNSQQFLSKMKELKPEALVVVAFGQKLGKDLLNLPPYGCINLHASLLPRYRGSSPIHQAIIDGQPKTGLTTMYMDEGWDTGDIIYQEEVVISPEDTVGSLHDKLALQGAKLLEKTLLAIEEGVAPRIKQNEAEATYAYKIKKERGEINWNESAPKIYNLVRGVNPWPGAYTWYQGQLIKIWWVNPKLEGVKTKAVEGEIIAASEKEGLLVQTGQGLIEIVELQLPGKRKMLAKDFLHGYNIKVGDRLG